MSQSELSSDMDLELRKFLEFYYTEVKNVPRDSSFHPSNVLVEAFAKFGLAKTRRGLRQAVNDIVEEVARFSPSDISRLDTILKEREIVTISALRRRYASAFKKVLARNYVRSDTEYLMLKAVLADPGKEFDLTEQAHLESLLVNFEERNLAGRNVAGRNVAGKVAGERKRVKPAN